MKLLLVLLCACGTAATTSTRHDTLESIPNAAASALRAKAGSAKIERVEREHEGGIEVFEALWHVDGLAREASANAAGDIIEYEEEVALANVPEPVRTAAASKLTGGELHYVKLMSGNFEVELIVDGREKGEAVFAPDGRTLADDDDEDDDEDD